jgi:hypothetical protein
MDSRRDFSSMSRNLPPILIAVVLLVSACQPRQTTPDIQSIVATGRAGTVQARTLATMVSATYTAIAIPTAAAGLAARPADKQAPATAPTAASTQDTCPSSSDGKTAYIDRQEGYCFLYPEDFFVDKPAVGTVVFLGAALDSSPEPLRAYITITNRGPVSGRTLDEIATSLWRESRNPYHVSNIRLGGQDALMAEGLVIGEKDIKSRQIFFTHNGSVYLITFSPVDPAEAYAKAMPDIQRFWDLATSTFMFIK